MPLKTLVKVGTITNLSDARYCAGMGVDMLGFRVMEGDENHIPIPLYQQIRGWVSGPKVVAELYGIKKAEDLQPVMVNYVPDLVEMTYTEYLQFGPAIQVPLIVSLSHDELIHVAEQHNHIGYWLVDEKHRTALDHYASSKPVLLQIRTKEEIASATENTSIAGLVLNGSPEIRPGFKNYDELADILEALETE